MISFTEEEISIVIGIGIDSIVFRCLKTVVCIVFAAIKLGLWRINKDPALCQRDAADLNDVRHTHHLHSESSNVYTKHSRDVRSISSIGPDDGARLSIPIATLYDRHITSRPLYRPRTVLSKPEATVNVNIPRPGWMRIPVDIIEEYNDIDLPSREKITENSWFWW